MFVRAHVLNEAHSKLRRNYRSTPEPNPAREKSPCRLCGVETKQSCRVCVKTSRQKPCGLANEHLDSARRTEPHWQADAWTIWKRASSFGQASITSRDALAHYGYRARLPGESSAPSRRRRRALTKTRAIQQRRGKPPANLSPFLRSGPARRSSCSRHTLPAEPCRSLSLHPVGPAADTRGRPPPR